MPTYYAECNNCGKPLGKRCVIAYCCDDCRLEARRRRARERSRRKYYGGDNWYPVPVKTEWINPAPWKGHNEDDFIYGNMIFL